MSKSKSILGDEYCTPPWIIELAKQVAGEPIQFDPATNELAQETIRATVYRTKHDVGNQSSLYMDWDIFRVIWCNPPYSFPLVALFADKFCKWQPRLAGIHGFFLCNSSTSAAWYQRLLKSSDAVLFFGKRINFYLDGVEKKGNRQPQTLFYFGDYAADGGFCDMFGGHGVVIRR